VQCGDIYDVPLIRWELRCATTSHGQVPLYGKHDRVQTVNVVGKNEPARVKAGKLFANQVALLLGDMVSFSPESCRSHSNVSDTGIASEPGVAFQQLHADNEMHDCPLPEFKKTWQVDNVSDAAVRILYNILQPLVPSGQALICSCHV
jgi:hypothetical protein